MATCLDGLSWHGFCVSLSGLLTLKAKSYVTVLHFSHIALFVVSHIGKPLMEKMSANIRLAPWRGN